MRRSVGPEMIVLAWGNAIFLLSASFIVLDLEKT